MVEIMSPIFEESESISQELLDTVLINIIKPHKVYIIVLLPCNVWVTCVNKSTGSPQCY
jgi:hypothetical protein